LLCELVPTAATVAFLTNGRGLLSFEEEKNSLVAAANALGRQLIIVECRSGDELGQSFATVVERGAGAVTVASQPFFAFNADAVVSFAAQYKIPAMYPGRGFALRGGLMSYTSDGAEEIRIATGLVGQILNGAMPAHLPVRRPTKFHFIINLKTAKQLGLMVPQRLLVFADELIEGFGP
jgi:putative tryptophan/tyrosine transport system substrate-binding protein